MVIGIFGENCTGKSTLANAVRDALGGEIVTGKDYLRMAKSESVAKVMFRKKLAQAVTGGNVIYVIGDHEQLAMLPDGAVRILVTADLATIKERFRQRMHGTLPAPVAMMLEKKHGCFDSDPHDFLYDGASGDTDALCSALRERFAE